MESDSESILGELLLEKEDIRVYRKGIAYYSSYLFWDKIKYIYVGGTKKSVNAIPTEEERTITLIDDFNGQIDISLSSIFRMGKEKRQLYNDVYSMILNNVFERQWSQFLQTIRAGTRLSIGNCEMTKDTFYFQKLFGGINTIKTSNIKGCYMNQGYFYIQYQEPNKKKLKNLNIGEVAKIPNIHLIQLFIKSINQ